jgi:hypothetical protein
MRYSVKMNPSNHNFAACSCKYVIIITIITTMSILCIIIHVKFRLTTVKNMFWIHKICSCNVCNCYEKYFLQFLLLRLWDFSQPNCTCLTPMIQQLLSWIWKLDKEFMPLPYYFIILYNKITFRIMHVFQRPITILPCINFLAPTIRYTCHALWCSKCQMSGIRDGHLMASLCRSL